jgi:DNA-directed RNA polymerase subunit RPC12/RpoP
MSVILLRFPALDAEPNQRPQACPYCGSQALQAWGSVSRDVRDTRTRTVMVLRFRCAVCGRTFRAYPEGIDRSVVTRRVRYIAALAYLMGFSCRSVAEIFAEQGTQISHMTIVRDSDALIGHLSRIGHARSIREFALDKGTLHNGRSIQGVKVAIDLGNRQPIILGVLDQYGYATVRAWLQPVCAEIGVELVETDTTHYEGV